MEGFYCRFLGGTAVCGFGLHICRGIDFECGEYLCRILIYGQVAFGRRSIVFEGVQKVFGTLDLFVSLLETEIKYPILQGGILPFWTPSFRNNSIRNLDIQIFSFLVKSGKGCIYRRGIFFISDSEPFSRCFQYPYIGNLILDHFIHYFGNIKF